MKVMNILHDSVVDGEGLRTVLFFSGCPHRCRGCHNPSSWRIENGIEMCVEEVVAAALNPLTNITLSGGEPFLQAMEVAEVAKRLKREGKNIWAYTGFTLEEIRKSGDIHKLELLSFCDVLVDGQFILSERDLTLKFRGSRNQQIHYLT
ncbi:anaerobic ribonucleoside-triphosphate reductase activating protein [Litchfieldia salsa]|uniref:Anaerobic ribonucleoside-triphosphate reductase-activating protein n=1 Tax=Litchfieldia salsa TaxID=930152 RepID=A0A1H0VY21_9BACI|nr:anaerobic ribonucleoside-triphosphate reductase activating protein [Litchfieldia salsa]SDP83427.1 ribonucleoside-triphosphate reductase class III activase subunit [Litchfieldia salsa]